jgi:serine/threonine-protein kinase RsbW
MGMSENGWVWRNDYTIPSEAGAGRGIVDDVLAQLQLHKWGDHDIFGIHLAVEEALANAIKHGNKLDTSKRVEVACRISPERFRIEITDEGPGFNPADVPDPTEPEQLEAPSGRGIMLMRSFMSLVEFNERGNQVILEKENNSPAAD